MGCACAGNTGNVFPATAGKRSRHPSRHMRDARAVMHDEIVNELTWIRWRGKRSRHYRRMRNPQLCVSGKRPIVCYVVSVESRNLYQLLLSGFLKYDKWLLWRFDLLFWPKGNLATFHVIGSVPVFDDSIGTTQVRQLRYHHTEWPHIHLSSAAVVEAISSFFPGQMAAISQTIFSFAFSWMKFIVFW